MGWCTTSDLDRFVAVSADYLKPRAAENALLLSAAQAARCARDARGRAAQAAGHADNAADWGQRRGAGSAGAAAAAEGDLLFGWWQPPEGSGPRGAFLHDPSAPLLIAGRAPEMAAALAASLAKAGRRVCGVDAPVEAADAFAAAWSQRSGMAVRVHRHSRVYRLARADGPLAQAYPAGPAYLAGPAGPADPAAQDGQDGGLRVATPTDRPLLVAWLAAFAAESGERIGSPEAFADDLIGYGGAAFWEIPPRVSRIREAAHYLAGPHHRDAAHRTEPACASVAMATVTRPVAGTARISMVYTPPERRRNGYAAAVTLAVSRAVLAGGQPPGAAGHERAMAPGPALVKAEQVVLITDRNRPDRRVARLGYQLVGERVVLRFGPPTGPLPRLRTGPMPRLPTGPLPRLRR